MRLLLRFLNVSWRDRALLAEALFYVSRTRTVLWIMPFRRLLLKSPVHSQESLTAERIAWAVNVASRMVPASTCLVRAISAEKLLAKYGYSSEVRIGVARSEERDFEAHAWLERGERILLGATADGRYVPLPLSRSAA